MVKYKIVWDDIIADDNLELERSLLEGDDKDDYELIRIPYKNTKDFLSKANNPDALCVYFPIGTKEIAQLKKCQIIAAPALGVDPFDLGTASKAGICICNAPNYCVEEVATHTVALVLDCSRKISRLDRHIRAGGWDWSERGIQHRLKGANYGLVSCGNIARRVGAIMNSFGMNIMGYDPFLPDDVFNKYGIKKVDYLEELLSKCDIISVHTPYTPQTRHMISNEQFACIKEGAIFVVTGRGGVVDELALKDAIISGSISAAALDVIEDEVTFQSVLRGLPEVIMTPHCAYYSEESTEELRRINMLQILDVLKYKKTPIYQVNKIANGEARFQKLQDNL